MVRKKAHSPKMPSFSSGYVATQVLPLVPWKGEAKGSWVWESASNQEIYYGEGWLNKEGWVKGYKISHPTPTRSQWSTWRGSVELLEPSLMRWGWQPGNSGASAKPRETRLQVIPALILDTNASRASIPLVDKECSHGNRRQSWILERSVNIA